MYPKHPCVHSKLNEQLRGESTVRVESGFDEAVLDHVENRTSSHYLLPDFLTICRRYLYVIQVKFNLASLFLHFVANAWDGCKSEGEV